MHRLLVVSIAFGCACCQREHGAQQSTGQDPARTTARAKPDTPATPAAQAEASVRVVPVAGARTRAQLRDELGEMVTLVEPAQFLHTLNAAQQTVEKFVRATEVPAQPRVLLASYSNHELRNHDLRVLVTRTLKAMHGVPGQMPPPRFYRATDAMTYPRVLVVWQHPDRHQVLRISLNNDNTAVSFWVGRGAFSATTYQLEGLEDLPRGPTVLEAAAFLDDAKTIYPHIEAYYVCPPECE